MILYSVHKIYKHYHWLYDMILNRYEISVHLKIEMISDDSVNIRWISWFYLLIFLIRICILKYSAFDPCKNACILSFTVILNWIFYHCLLLFDFKIFLYISTRLWPVPAWVDIALLYRTFTKQPRIHQYTVLLKLT